MSTIEMRMTLHVFLEFAVFSLFSLFFIGHYSVTFFVSEFRF